MRNKPIYLILLIIINTSCQQILFNDIIINKEIALEKFHSVAISGIFNLLLIQDSLNILKISGSNSADKVEAIVNDDTLSIIDNSGLTLNTIRTNLELHFTTLDFMITYDPLNFSTMDTIKSENLLFEPLGEIGEGSMTVDCKTLTVVNSANTLGYMKFKGKSEKCSFFIRYGGALFADSLICKDAEITTETIGDIFINASDYLNVSILSNGNIYYYGNPVMTITEKRGSGNLIKK